MCAKKTPIAPPAQTPRPSPPPPVVQCCGLRASVALHNWAFISHTPNALGSTAGSTLIAGRGGAHRNTRGSWWAFFSHTPGSRKVGIATFEPDKVIVLETYVFTFLVGPRAAAGAMQRIAGTVFGRQRFATIGRTWLEDN